MVAPIVDGSYRQYVQKANEVFRGPVPGQLVKGHMVTITGIVLQGCSRYSINFQTGEDEIFDYVLHFNPRLELNYIVRNYTIRGKWGKEETTSLDRIDIYKQKEFKYSFFMTTSEIYIAMNDRHYCVYKLRLPLNKIKVVVVRGQVEVTSYLTTLETAYPTMEMLENVLVLPTTEMERTQLPIPFKAKFETPFVDSYQVNIVGKVKLLPIKIVINLQETPHIWPHPNIPVHYNPRFSDPYHVVMNTWQNGSWAQEEKSDTCKFLPGHEFHLVFIYNNDEISIWHNGVMTELFQMRATNININYILIQGDLYLYQVWTNKTHIPPTTSVISRKVKVRESKKKINPIDRKD